MPGVRGVGVACEPGRVTLRVMTWNLWWRFGDWERRERAIVEVLRATNPDVVCLQETWAVRSAAGKVELQVERLTEQLGMSAVHHEPVWYEGQAFVNAILARGDLRRTLDAALPNADGAPGHRRVVGALVDTPWGGWPVVCAHLDHRFDGSGTRERQVGAVLGHVADRRGDPASDLPVILGGDLNAVPDSDEIRVLTGRRAGGPPGIVMSDVWEQVGQGRGETWIRTNPAVADSAWPDRRIDYLAVSWPRPKPVGNPVSAWRAGDRATTVDGVPVWPSDHAAVVAELTTPE